MKTLIKTFLVLFVAFASTFVIIKATGIITIDDIKAWLGAAASTDPVYVALIIAVLLFADLFIAIPTLTVCILAGYFLGFGGGAIAAATGITLAGICGHVISRTWGRGILNKIVKDKDNLADMEQTFQRHGYVMILLSRAMPVLPEITACLSGLTKMPPAKFIVAWMLGSYPYILIASYAGSVSTFENFMPAIYTAIAITCAMWIAWWLFYNNTRRDEQKSLDQVP
jgi:uncharacterized membrane protein YdjX (TVP38/TMEM64 family)